MLFGLYLRCLPGTFYFEDSPELIACAAGLGNTHPPGYPLLMLLGRLAQLLPVGTPAFRFNLFIAAWGAGAAVALAALVAHLTASWSVRWVARWAGMFAGAVWALSDAFWWESVIGDKYAPYYFGFIMLVWISWAALNARLPEQPRMFAWLGLACGLAFAHHQYAVFALPVVVAALWWQWSHIGPASLSGLRWFGARVRPARTLVLMACLAVLPLSTKCLYPPVRSSASAELDWGRPGTAGRLWPYLKGQLYHHAFAEASLPANPQLWAGRLKLAFKFLKEELPLPMLVGVPVGVVVVARGYPLFALGLLGCLLANVAYAVNFSEKIVRWYEPAYALLLVMSALGFAWIVGHIKTAGVWWMAALALAAPVLQWHRGIARNDLSRFTAAHDLGRNLLRSLPPGSVYLGAGDFDLFPLWALRYVEGERKDVEAIGLASFVDPQLAATGGQERLKARLGTRDAGPETPLALLTAPDAPPVMVAAAGYDRQLHELMPFLKLIRYHGIAGRLLKHWDAGGSVTETTRIERTYTYRGLRYARSGALFDLKRMRDEVARGALLLYPASFASLGNLCLHFRLTRDAARAFGLARSQMAALAGPLSVSQATARLPPERAAVESGRQAVALGYHRLADVFEARGVTFLARQFRANAAAIAQQ